MRGRGEAKSVAREEDRSLREELDRLLKEVRFGSITLIVQDGRVVQIDVTHKLRFDKKVVSGEGLSIGPG